MLVLSACASHDQGPEDDSAGNGQGQHLTPEADDPAFAIEDSLLTAASDSFPKPSGRVVSIMITGVDSRLGDRGGRADANHVVRLFLDAGQVEVISIPRDTEADAGFVDDTTGLNKLANVRANRGRNTYFNEVCRIASIPKIDYWVEFGFSQAIGLIELMGGSSSSLSTSMPSTDGQAGSPASSNSRASQTLRVLRARKSLRMGDYQRVYNQGQYIRRAVVYGMNHVDEVSGGLALRAALLLVETNLTYATCQSLASQLRASGFDGSPERVWVRLKPVSIRNLQTVSFTAAAIDSVYRSIESLPPDTAAADSSRPASRATYVQRLTRLVESSVADSAKRPGNVVRNLQRPFEQRAWLQITDLATRRYFRQRIGSLLSSAYERVGRASDAERVRAYIREEQALIEGR